MISPRIATLVLSVVLMTMASPIASADSAPAPANLEAMLKAQDLTMVDLEANRAGSVSEHQAVLVDKARGGLSVIGIAGIGSLFVLALGFALYDYSKKSKPVVFILPAIAAVVGIGFWIFFAKVLQVPSVRGERVTAVSGPVESLLLISSGGGYNISIQGVRYKGLATGLSESLKGQQVTAYVVPATKMVVAIEPK